MCFKRMICAWAALTLALAGCGVKVGEKPPEQTPVSYSGKGYTCVSQIPQHIEKYMKDQLGDAEITEFVRCLQKAFSSFAQYTRGREQSNYQADEIRNFLQKSFIKDRTISDELLHEFMVIKQALVGGDQQRITRTELFDAIQFLEDLRVEAIRLRPHIRVLNTRLVEEELKNSRGPDDERKAQEMSERLAAASVALRESIQSIAVHLGKTKRNYPIANLEAFLLEFRDFVRWEEHFPNARPVAKWVALLRAFKETAVSPVEPDIIREEDWAPLLQAMANWYVAYLQYTVGIKDRPKLHGMGLQNSVYLVNQAIELTRAAIRNQGGLTPTLTFEQINRLVISVHDVGWIPENIRPESIDQAVRAFTVRMTGDASSKPSNRRARGLDKQSMAVLDAEFQRWANIQSILDKQHRGTHVETASVPNVQNLSGSQEVFANRFVVNPGSNWDEFIKVNELMRPLFADEFPRVMLVPDSRMAEFGLMKDDFYNLSMMNLLRSIAGLVFRGYAETSSSPWQWTSGIKGTEMQAFYLDFRNIGIDLGWVDKRNTSAGSRAFVEGKLFTSSSKGLNYDASKPDAGEMSFVETMEYFAFLYSGGQEANDIYKQLREVLCKPKADAPLDPNSLPKLERTCVQGALPQLMKTYMTNMPFLSAYLEKLAPGAKVTPEIAAYVNVMVETARQPGVSQDGWVEKNELSTMAVVMHYAESIMNRFDQNQDGKLDTKELDAAVPLFSGFIKKINHDQQAKVAKPGAKITELSDAEARAALYYILAKKQVPISGWAKFSVWWDTWWWDPTMSLDRMELAQVFQAIIAKLFEMGRAPVPPPIVPISASMPGIPASLSAAPSPTR